MQCNWQSKSRCLSCLVHTHSIADRQLSNGLIRPKRSKETQYSRVFPLQSILSHFIFQKNLNLALDSVLLPKPPLRFRFERMIYHGLGFCDREDKLLEGRSSISSGFLWTSRQPVSPTHLFLRDGISRCLLPCPSYAMLTSMLTCPLAHIPKLCHQCIPSHAHMPMLNHSYPHLYCVVGIY